MPVRQYFDGSSGKRGEIQVISLAAVCATETAWDRFHVKWKALLEKHDLVDHGVHTKEMMARKGRVFGNWTEEHKADVIRDALDAFTVLTPEVRSCVCSIDMQHHRRLKAEDPRLIDEYSMCVEVTFNHAFVERHEEKKDKTILLCFDQDEPFMDKIKQVWSRKKKKATGWPRQIANIEQVSRQDYAIQGVDLLAWIGRRHHTHGDVEVYRTALALCSFCDFEFMDYDRMQSEPRFFRPRRKGEEEKLDGSLA